MRSSRQWFRRPLSPRRPDRPSPGGRRSFRPSLLRLEDRITPTNVPNALVNNPALDAPPFPVIVRSFGITNPGKVRSSNEDNFLIAELARTLWVRQASVPQQETQHGRSRGHLFLVADGMGGHQAGEVASALSITSVEEFVLDILKRFSNLEATEEQAVLQDFKRALRQADVAGETVIFPLGPALFLSWANCDATVGRDQTKVYRCELKPEYQFPGTSTE